MRKRSFIVLSPENVNVVVDAVQKIIKKEDGNPNFWHNQIADEFFNDVRVGSFDDDYVDRMSSLSDINQTLSEYTYGAGSFGNHKPVTDGRYLLMRKDDVKVMSDIVNRAHEGVHEAGLQISAFFRSLPSTFMEARDVLSMNNVKSAWEP